MQGRPVEGIEHSVILVGSRRAANNHAVSKPAASANLEVSIAGVDAIGPPNAQTSHVNVDRRCETGNAG